MAKYLYGASVQGIQEFIFATNELKTIIGASEIINNINQKIEKKYPKNIIINAAGNIKLLFDEKSEFDSLVEEFLKETKQAAFGLTISQAVVAFEEGSLKDAMQELEKKLHIQRNKNEIPLDMSINILKLAPKSGKPMIESEKDKATVQKENAYIFDELGDISKIKNKKNKIAIIHADGNGLGVMIANMSKELQTDEEVKEAYKNFSTKLDEATVAAFKIAKENTSGIKLRQVILGGDDLTVICDANSALDFTNKFLKAFEEQTKQSFNNEGLTACAGIAYCNQKYPFHYAVNLAESLCAYSKGHSKAVVKESKKPAPSSLMFHDIQSSNFSDFKEYIDKELTLSKNAHEVFLNYGPYFTSQTQNYSTVDAFIYLVNAFKAKGSPISRLREWLTILGQNPNAAHERLERISQVMDLNNKIYNKKALETCLRKFNPELTLSNLIFVRDGKKYTPIHDVDAHLSVIDYVKEEHIEECEV